MNYQPFPAWLYLVILPLLGLAWPAVWIMVVEAAKGNHAAAAVVATVLLAVAGAAAWRSSDPAHNQTYIDTTTKELTR